MPVSRLPPRVVRFLLLGLLLSTANTYASTLAATQFLSAVGAEGLPLYYVLFAVVSIPVAVALARAVDRIPRIPLLVALAAVVGLAATAGSFAAGGDETGTTAVYLGVAVFEQLSYSVFYVLLADHFTALEVNRHSGLVSTAMAGGGLVGGGLVWAGTFLASPQTLLLAMPVLVLPAAAAALWIRRVDAPAGDGGVDGAEESLAESLRSFPRIVARHPIALFIAAGVLLNQVTQCVTEYQSFSVYQETFPQEQDLAAFLGLMNAGLNLVGLAVSALATTPLIRRFGIGGMNLFFPAVTLLAFVWLSVDFALPAAIFGHVVYDAMANAVDQPVTTGTYNALPNRFVARIRVVADGIVYPVALAGAGAVLMVAQDRLDPLGISLLGVVLAALFVLVGFGLRLHYRRGMLGLLRDGAVELGAAEERIGALPEDRLDGLREMLRSADPDAQRLGLELVARADVARVLRDVAPALPRADPAVRRRLADRVRRGLDPDVLATIRDMARSPVPAVRALAVDVLAAGRPAEADLGAWVADPDPEIAAVATVRLAVRSGDVGLLARPLADATPTIRLAMVHACATEPTAAALTVLGPFVGDRDPGVRVAALDLVRGWVDEGRVGPLPVGWVTAGIDADDPEVRAAALRLAAAAADPDGVARLVRACADAHETVRTAAVDGLAAVGEAAVSAVRTALVTADPASAPALLEALARVGGRRAEAAVAEHLGTLAFDPIERRRRWRRALGIDDRHAGLRLALDDADARATETAMRIVGTLGYRRTMALVRTALATGDERTRANAVEALMSLSRRRLVAPLLAVLDPDGVPGGGGADPAAVLAEAAADVDPWVRAGAAHATGSPDGEIMNRLLFLKTVPLFAGLTLDDLVSVDAALEHEAYLAGETVIAEGGLGDKLYLLLEGAASVTAGGRAIASLSAGACFGEMAMFDLAPRSATVTATADCTLLSMRRDRFRSLVAQRPQVLMEICRVFGDRLRATNQLVVRTVTSDPAARSSSATASSPGSA